MEKRTPHYPLHRVKELINEGNVRITKVATNGAFDMGFNRQGQPSVLETILSLTSQDFYKSMTCYNDHKQWQDVYRPSTKLGDVYLKFTIVEHLLIISFKEL